MSAQAPDLLSVQSDIADFGTLALEAIHALQRRITELQGEVEDLSRENALLAAALDRLDPEGAQR